MQNSPPPIFIVGHPRSGSTLLASQLGRHPDLAALPETHFFNSSYSGSWIKRWQAGRSRETLMDWCLDRNVRLQDLDLSRDDLDHRLEASGKLSIKAVFDAVLKSAAERAVKSRIVEKTPRHIEHIDRLLEWYPQAKVICIIRDPRDAIQSLLDAKWTHSDARRHALFWNWCAHEGLRQQAARPQSVLVLRYEDLLADHEKVLQLLLRFVGEGDDLGFLKHEVDPETIPTWERDWKAKAGAKIDPNMANQWAKSPNSTHALWTRWTRQGLEKMGYETNVPGWPAQGPFSALSANLVGIGFAAFYALWRLYRTHLSGRKYRFRKEQLASAPVSEI
ncbi:MAG: sulfotransferase [Erythrobacter sp.]